MSKQSCTKFIPYTTTGLALDWTQDNWQPTRALQEESVAVAIAM